MHLLPDPLAIQVVSLPGQDCQLRICDDGGEEQVSEEIRFTGATAADLRKLSKYLSDFFLHWSNDRIVDFSYARIFMPFGDDHPQEADRLIVRCDKKQMFCDFMEAHFIMFGFCECAGQRLGEASGLLANDQFEKVIFAGKVNI